ncbi:tRNA dimethylallyltransferase [Lachnospiraceae bacterium KHCPX20]|nr:tRNA dimethylallyltransferase [Lachnospiraceae bacterium KHCPX20]
MEKKTLVILTGPTAVGKTALSIELARKINASIISADSMQIYRGMDVGTAKVTKEEMQEIRHYGIDILSPDQDYDVTRFVKMAKEAIEEITSEGKIPLVVGGTGFYIQALLYDIDFEEEKEDSALRLQLADIARQNGKEALHEMLASVDPKSAASIPCGNVKRMVRALEYYHHTGEKFSEYNQRQSQKKSPYDFHYFVLTDDRAALYERINQRVDLMMEQGIVEEAEKLFSIDPEEKHTAAKAIGYREFYPYFRGECTLEDVVYRIKLDTRHFAKRQLTWFRREEDVEWFDRREYKDEDEILRDMLRRIKE